MMAILTRRELIGGHQYARREGRLDGNSAHSRDDRSHRHIGRNTRSHVPRLALRKWVPTSSCASRSAVDCDSARQPDGFQALDTFRARASAGSGVAVHRRRVSGHQSSLSLHLAPRVKVGSDTQASKLATGMRSSWRLCRCPRSSQRRAVVEALIELLFHKTAHILVPVTSFGKARTIGVTEQSVSAFAIKRMPDGTVLLGSFQLLRSGAPPLDRRMVHCQKGDQSLQETCMLGWTAPNGIAVPE